MKFLKNSLVCLVFVFLVCSLTACGNKEASKTSKEPQTMTITDVAGREVTVKIPVKKAVINWSGSGGAFMTMSALLEENVADYIAGWGNSLEENRYDVYEHCVSKVPGLKNIPNIGSVDTDDFNLEKVIQLKPDVCIFALGTKKQADASVEEKLSKAGIPIVYIDYHAETEENHTNSTLLMGKLFDKEKRAQKIVDFCMGKRRDLEKRLSEITDKPKTYIECANKGADAYGNTYPNNNMWGGMIRIAGGKNIAGDIVSKSEPINPEFLLKENPDYIFLTGAYWPKTQDSLRVGYLSTAEDIQKITTQITNRIGWNELNAVKNKNVYYIYHGLGREIYDYASLEFIAKALHPEAFKDIDPMNDLKEYFDTFLPYDLTGDWMGKWQ